MRILLYYVRSIFKKKFDVEVLNGTVIRLEPFKTYIVESFNNELGLKIFTVRISYQGYELIIRVDEENLTRLIKAKID